MLCMESLLLATSCHRDVLVWSVQLLVQGPTALFTQHLGLWLIPGITAAAAAAIRRLWTLDRHLAGDGCASVSTQTCQIFHTSKLFRVIRSPQAPSVRSGRWRNKPQLNSQKRLRLESVSRRRSKLLCTSVQSQARRVSVTRSGSLKAPNSSPCSDEGES